MKAVIFPKQAAELEIANDVPVPEPGDDQVLVKSIWTAINPVDTFCAEWGLLVESWPLTLGVDAGGVVVKAGSKVPASLAVGTDVFGCTRLGVNGHGTAASFYLMDAQVTFPITAKMKDRGITKREACTLGVALETAALAIFCGLDVSLDELKEPVSPKDEWIVILGASSSVGQRAIQLAQAAGYKVLGSVSSRSAAVVEAFGAKTFDYKQSLEAQAKEVMEITGGKFHRVFDAVAADDPELPKLLFKTLGDTKGPKFFTTTNDWSGIPDFEGGKSYLISFGPVGRPTAKELNANLESYVPHLIDLLEKGKVTPSEVDVVGDESGDGFENAIKAYKYQKTGKGGSKKVIVKIQDE